LIDLRLGFLDTDKIGSLARQPLEKTLARRRANTVGVD
jgi:hypothetical protein